MAVEMAAKNGVISLEAGADLRTNQYHGVAIHTATLQVALGVATGNMIIGVLLNKPNTGQEALVFVGPGLCPIECGAGGVTIQHPISTDGDGEFENGADEDICIGWAMETGTDGQIVTAFITPVGQTSDASKCTGDI